MKKLLVGLFIGCTLLTVGAFAANSDGQGMKNGKAMGNYRAVPARGTDSSRWKK